MLGDRRCGLDREDGRVLAKGSISLSLTHTHTLFRTLSLSLSHTLTLILTLNFTLARTLSRSLTRLEFEVEGLREWIL